MTTEPKVKLTDIPVIEEYLVTGIIGEKGSGKSLLTAMLAEGARIRENRKVFYFPEEYKFHEGEALTLNDIYTMDIEAKKGRESKYWKSVVLIEEIQRVFSKYGAATYRNQSFQSMMQQIRKLGIELIWNSNDPDGIDDSIIPQTDIHMRCIYFEDDRCRAYGYHRSDCKDRIIARVVDTQRKHGRNPNHYDGRKRYTTRFREVVKYFSLYNTFASVSATEISMMDKNAVLQAHSESQSTTTVQKLENLLAERIIPHIVVNLGWDRVIPSRFAKWLETATDENDENMNIVVSPKMLGMALANLGLPKKRNSAGMVYMLPEPDDIVNWQSGGGSSG